MKACIIGDSHAAMLVGGKDLLDRPDLEVTTFAQPGSGPEEVSFDGSTITAEGADLKRFLDRMGTPHSLDLNGFDAVILATKTATAFNVFELLKGYRVSDWAKADSFTDLFKDVQLITEAALQACLQSAIQSNLSYRLCTEIRDRCDVPIFITRNPHLVERTLELRPKLGGLRRILERGDGTALRASLDAAHIAAFAGINNVQVLSQPQSTIVQGCLTKEDYSRDSVRLGSSKPHFETDILHAGPKLGALLWEEIFRLHQPDQ